eukprot:Gb_40973 [translate_table: standard]
MELRGRGCGPYWPAWPADGTRPLPPSHWPFGHFIHSVNANADSPSRFSLAIWPRGCRHNTSLSIQPADPTVMSVDNRILWLHCSRRPVREFGDRVDIVQWGRKMTNSVKEGVLNVLDSRLYTVPLHEIMHVFYVAHAMCRRTECRKANHEEDLKN